MSEPGSRWFRPGASGPQVFVMLLAAGWLPSWALACWQVRHRRLPSPLLSDLLGAGLLTLLACSLNLPLFFFTVAWFLRIVCFVKSIGAGSTSKLCLFGSNLRSADIHPQRSVANALSGCDRGAGCHWRSPSRQRGIGVPWVFNPSMSRSVLIYHHSNPCVFCSDLSPVPPFFLLVLP